MQEELPMHTTINPNALKTYRGKRGLKQSALAEKLGCSIAQVSRWERGVSRNIRAHLRDKLPKVLGCTWENLTQPPEARDEAETKPWNPKAQLKVQIHPAALNALRLVSKRFRIPAHLIVELAPLLFLIAAEKSLARRRAGVEAIENRLSRVTDQEKTDIRHLPQITFGADFNDDPIFGGDFYDVLRVEHESISKRDVLGQLSDWETNETVDYENPFVTYLRTEVADLPEGSVWGFRPDLRREVDYNVALDELQEITGLDVSKPGEDDLIEAIADGKIDLREAILQRKSVSLEEFKEWLEQKLDEHERRIDLEMGLSIEIPTKGKDSQEFAS
jgi:transcriptional regulator with XRE-family HTH domain